MDALTASPQQSRNALGLSTFAFTMCFAVWTLFAIIGIEIKDELGLSETQFGLLVGTPILTGSLVRILLGVWTDQYGGRIVLPLTMLASAASTYLLTFATTYPMMLLAALGRCRLDSACTSSAQAARSTDNNYRLNLCNQRLRSTWRKPAGAARYRSTFRFSRRKQRSKALRCKQPTARSCSDLAHDTLWQTHYG